MSTKSFEIITSSNEYQNFVTAELNVDPSYYLDNTGEQIYQDSVTFSNRFRVGEPLPKPILESFNCRACSNALPYISRVSRFDKKQLPNQSFPNEVHVDCSMRAELVNQYLEEYHHWDQNKDRIAIERMERHDNQKTGLVTAKDPLENLSAARNAVRGLGCSQRNRIKIPLEKSNILSSVELIRSSYTLNEEPNSRIAANLLLGSLEYIGRNLQRFEDADQIEAAMRQSRTALNFTALLTNLLISGENKYISFQHREVRVFSLRDILSSIDGYDILDRSFLSQNTLTIALLALNKFIMELDSSGIPKELVDDYHFALSTRTQLLDIAN